MLRELWTTHWRSTHGRDWDNADGHAFVHGGAIAPFDKPVPGLRFRARGGNNQVKVFGGDPAAVLKKGCSLQLGGHVFTVEKDPQPPTVNVKDPSKPGWVRQDTLCGACCSCVGVCEGSRGEFWALPCLS